MNGTGSIKGRVEVGCWWSSEADGGLNRWWSRFVGLGCLGKLDGIRVEGKQLRQSGDEWEERIPRFEANRGLLTASWE